MTASNNKRIAKNTLFLYFRMFLIMGLSLYTSRIVLKALGAEDFGLYNVVAGVVTMLGFVNGSLINASSRFITYSLGTKDELELKRTFNSIITIHLLFVFVIALLAETIGLWFVTTQLVIPAQRMTAAIWAYQSAVVVACLMFLYAPYNALIIAHERMTAFAYVSVFDKAAQLLVVILVSIVTYDKLIAYSIFVVCVQLVVLAVYFIYCWRNFSVSHFSLSFEKSRLKKIFSYAGWVLNGNLAYLGYTQGINILLNIYFGPIVNAARGLSVQVQSAILSFTNNFQTAVNPQIIKSYAQHDYIRMHQLVLMSSRIGFYLMLLIIIPLYFNIDYVLGMWLNDVPEHTALFVKIMLVLGLNSTLKNPTLTAIHATGDVKRFQLYEGGLLLTILPIAWLLLKFYHISPEAVICVYLVIELFTQFIRIWIVYPKIELQIKLYYTKILCPCILVSAVVVGLVYLLKSIYFVDNFFDLVGFIVINSFITLVVVFILGINRYERNYVINIINKKIYRK